MYCGKTIKGERINRMKQHLAKKSGEVGPCEKVLPDIWYQIHKSLKAFDEKKKQSEENYDQLNPYGLGGFQFEGDDVYVNVDDEDDEDDEVVETIPEGAGSGNKSKAPMTQKGYEVSTYHQLQVPLLRDSKKELQLYIDILKSLWAVCGCTIMGDDWTDGRQRNLINFLVYSSMRIAFVQPIDAFDAVKDATPLSKLFLEVIEWVGVSNVVHMVIDNGANCKVARGLVNATYKSINWSSCVAHCLNLILSEISKMNHVDELTTKASTVTRHMYNRSWLLARLRKKKSWTEIVRPGTTRFAITFLALHSIHEHMHDLQALDCFITIKIVEPLMCLLRIDDGDKKLSMGYVYEGIYRAIKGIKDIFKRNKRLYRPYTTIIKTRWDNQLQKNIHAAAY
ncbi:uncharacterized protein LOC114291178 [Camellia sinensis]|uniref:uncharacterized protein LOC114291178 n=1 Tax=Camellia sinensis TaxID=4442 RepID=UPI00103669D5|nr:uncharacterized protein LOC114291178 [Camellia sinensis]